MGNFIKCDKCDRWADKITCYHVRMPVAYIFPPNTLKVCEPCFNKMWNSFPSGEKGVNSDEGILNRTEE